MLFGRRKKAGPPRNDSNAPAGSPGALGYLIDFDMMLKGRIYDRSSGPIRQFGVTVNGSTKLVTSGEWVNRDTYYALIDAGAIPPDGNAPSPQEALVDDSEMETIERQE